jgi:hypothetical protein
VVLAALHLTTIFEEHFLYTGSRKSNRSVQDLPHVAILQVFPIPIVSGLYPDSIGSLDPGRQKLPTTTVKKVKKISSFEY